MNRVLNVISEIRKEGSIEWKVQFRDCESHKIESECTLLDILENDVPADFTYQKRVQRLAEQSVILGKPIATCGGNPQTGRV